MTTAYYLGIIRQERRSLLMVTLKIILAKSLFLSRWAEQLEEEAAHLRYCLEEHWQCYYRAKRCGGTYRPSFVVFFDTPETES